MKIIYMGTPLFSAYILEQLLETKHEVIAIVSQPNRRVGRKKELLVTPVAKIAIEKNIRLYQPEKISEIYQELADANADIFITAAYGQIIPEKILNLPSKLPINVHGSLLPKYRGAAPIHYAVLNGEKQTGVTIMKMIKKMDAGSIIKQASFPILENDTTEVVHNKMMKIGADLLIETLSLIENNNYTLTEQDDNLVTFSPAILRKDELIEFSLPANVVHNKIRGLDSWPIGYTYFQGKILKIKNSKLISSKKKGIVGELVELTNQGIVIQCKDSCVLVKDIKIEGKQWINAYQYFQNFANKKNIILGVIDEK